MDNLKKGDIVNIFGVSDFMATTTHATLKATGEYNISNDNQSKPIFTDNKKGARKRFTLRTFGKDQLVFLGEVPFCTDSEAPAKESANGFSTTTYRGNACINLVGDPTIIREWIDTKNINPNFTRHDSVIIIDGDKEIPLYMDIPTSHSVVLALRANQ